MSKNTQYTLLILTITVITMIGLFFIPGYLRELAPTQPQWNISGVLIFTLFNILTIFPLYKAHKKLSADYSPIKNVWFFVLFGGITGGLIGEGGNPVMILPYSLLMLIYANLYKRYPWWKVALSSYLGGILIESGMNRSPIQVTTIMWIAFFIYPYFATKIYDNRDNIDWKKVRAGILKLVLWSIALGILAYLFTRNNPSPPLIFLGTLLPFLIAAMR